MSPVQTRREFNSHLWLVNYFETKLVRLLNLYFKHKNIKAIAYRSKQTKYNFQFYDILVDSEKQHLYLAIECKTTKYMDLYFKRNFKSSQINMLNHYRDLSGRTAYLAVKIKRQMYMLPWHEVLDAHKTNTKIEYATISKYLFDEKDENWLDKHLYIIN